MPRKKIFYTHEFPYHVYARSNNREWFYLPTDEVWEIFVSEINRLFKEYKMSLHSFVLMSNHYHMLVTAHQEHPLSKVMCELQKSVSRNINKKAKRSNHIFGGPYKASLIRSEGHYLDIYKYIYRNPVRAGIVNNPMAYPYSTLNSDSNNFLVLNHREEIQYPKNREQWLCTELEEEMNQRIKRGLKKTEYKNTALRVY